MPIAGSRGNPVPQASPFPLGEEDGAELTQQAGATFTLARPGASACISAAGQPPAQGPAERSLFPQHGEWEALENYVYVWF